jgi:hypothetical protein
MLFRHTIYRLFLCLAFVMSSSYVQAMSHVDELQRGATYQEVGTHLPPCHRAMNDKDTEKGAAHHGGCCSNFACGLGLAVESVMPKLVGKLPSHDAVPARVLHSALLRPLFPPPKLM